MASVASGLVYIKRDSFLPVIKTIADRPSVHTILDSFRVPVDLLCVTARLECWREILSGMMQTSSQTVHF